MNQELLNSLYNTRQKIKAIEKQTTGRTPLVCNDDALVAIAEMEPKKIGDLEGIPGIGKSFIENYGKVFVDIVREFTSPDDGNTVNINEIAEKTLRELEKKLVSINRRNRLLYMPKLTSKYAYDMYNSGSYNLPEILFGHGKEVPICNSTASDAEAKNYKNIVSLLREVSKDLRDKGQNDLYVGYPFVIGRIPGEHFDVRCPLALYPVKATRTSTKISLSYDDSRDAIYNGTLVLAYYKFNNINKPLPDPEIEELSKEAFLRNLITYYKDNGIILSYKGGGFSKFTEYTSKDFPSFTPGDLSIENNMVLGKYPVCSSSIQKDFDAILASGSITNSLCELLLEVNDLDYESDAIYGDREDKEDDTQLVVSEKDLTYFNDLDSSQENVLAAINKIDNLVIQGPPGTGKSQVITGLIAEFINQDKNVLMVSEKKTALDVVYSRLGELSKYALLMDDTSNKDIFYSQIDQMLFANADNAIESEKLDMVSTNIDQRITILEQLAIKLYKVNSFGIEPYKLYIMNKKIDMSNQEEASKTAKINELVSGDISTLTYGQIELLHKKFKNESLIEKLNTYYVLQKAFPWLNYAKKGLNQIELFEFSTDYNNFANQYNEYKSQNIFKQLTARGKIKKQAKMLASKYYESSIKEITKLLMINPEQIKNAMDNYISFDECLALYNTCTDMEKQYSKAISEAKIMYESLDKANDEIFNTIIFKNILLFENENKDILRIIDQYHTIISEISELISLKKTLTKEILRAILCKNMENITLAKRRGEIQRIVESKRRWSVNRFISKYSFELFKSVKIWLLTPEVVSEIMPLETGLFDLVIFDEASQMYIEKGLPAIQRAKKIVIAGDHKQLRPSSLGSGRMEMDEEDLPEEIESSAALEEESLLDLARFKYRDVMLNFHYRSKYEELIAFSNHAFYKGRLFVSPNTVKTRKPPIEFRKIENAIWSNRANLKEGQYVLKLLKVILEGRKNNETIGIITFNANQRNLILDLIDDECAVDNEFAIRVKSELEREENGEDIGLFVKNIESVQGDERDIIIFSVGYAKNENGRLIRNFGWLNQKGGENRLNVAISRAKTKIYVIASFDPEELVVEDTKNDGPKYFKKYLQYAKAVNDDNKELVSQILHSFGDTGSSGEDLTFDSDFENQVYDALMERLEGMGYTIDTQIGVGGYSIDQAIKKDGKYILGIECDGKTYHSSKSARERDYHRQKYLESRGWRIHRIWSTDWWKNPQREIDKIYNILTALSNQNAV